MSFSEEASGPAYDRWAEHESKAYIGFFLLTCLLLAVFTSLHLGWLWLLILPLGLICASVLGGLFNIAGKYAEHKGILILPSLLRLGGLVAVVLTTYWTIQAIGD